MAPARQYPVTDTGTVAAPAPSLQAGANWGDPANIDFRGTVTREISLGGIGAHPLPHTKENQ